MTGAGCSAGGAVVVALHDGNSMTRVARPWENVRGVQVGLLADADLVRRDH